MVENTTPNSQVKFKDTLNLPTTTFPIRANPKIDDPAMLRRWQEQGLFDASFTKNKGNEKFILHDGPPYANGHLHLGHAYNKILKDIVTKSQRMCGNHVPVTPGWDCHGLPIELKVTQENPNVSAQELKKACREYAQRWITIQKEEFKALGVLMDWEHPYLTMAYDYEANILRAFASFVEQGYIERKNKTVPWCPSCQTVLATAEIEYEERKDPSIYVMFPLEQNTSDQLFADLKGKQINLLVWTTTPWTLPLNRAVLLKPNAQYVVLELQDKYILVAQQLADKVCALVSTEKKVVAQISSDELFKNKTTVLHPFIENLHVPILLDQSVSLEDGTACVHCAPGCGPEDYEVGIKNKLEIFSPLSPDGKYTHGIAPQELEGMSIGDGQIWVIKKLHELNRLFFKSSIRHSYPHCWRCHGGLMFRATKQWFCDLSKNNLKQQVLQATQNIATLPDKSINRLQATLEGRLEWCLSRQRIWGVPIPSFICKKCDYTYITSELVNKVAEHVAQQGIEYWDSATVTALLSSNFSCPQCHSIEFKKETDILDVWFDSGISHYAVLYNNKNLSFPAEMYLEGKDQHRGWFQSSLLTSMVLEKTPCMKMIVTHGFTVDEKGRKMSKSLGNVVTPGQVIEKLGTDGLRLWVSTIDYASEAVISETLLQNVQEVFRKIRNTCRFLLSNLYDFDKDKDALNIEDMRIIDQYALQKLFIMNDAIIHNYKKFDFTAVFQQLAEYSSVELSAFYLDIIKDRLYVEKANGFERRSAQTACWYILDALTRLIAPILSFTAEQISDVYQKNKTDSIHLQDFATLHEVKEFFVDRAEQMYTNTDMLKAKRVAIETLVQTQLGSIFQEFDIRWSFLKEVRSALLKAIEEIREKAIVKHSLEVRVIIHFDHAMKHYDIVQEFFKELQTKNQTPASFFEEFVIVSQVEFEKTKHDLNESEYKGMYVKVEHALGEKCPRCWKWTVTKHEHNLCDRCYEIVKK